MPVPNFLTPSHCDPAQTYEPVYVPGCCLMFRHTDGRWQVSCFPNATFNADLATALQEMAANVAKIPDALLPLISAAVPTTGGTVPDAALDEAHRYATGQEVTPCAAD